MSKSGTNDTDHMHMRSNNPILKSQLTYPLELWKLDRAQWKRLLEVAFGDYFKESL